MTRSVLQSHNWQLIGMS